MRIVFMGTPSFAVPTLRRLLEDGHEIVAVVTQPDRAAGRGRRLMASPVKELAIAHGLRVLQPERVRAAPFVEELRALAPEVVVVAAFGQILPRAILEIPPLGCLNVHASLLPRHRGAAPIAAAILAGDDVTGVTIMLMDTGLDTGAMLARVEERILPSDTTGSLSERLALVGARLLGETLPRWAAKKVVPQAQDDSLATYAPQLRKEDGELRWSEPAHRLWLRARAMDPWPGAYTTWQGSRLRVFSCLPLCRPGTERQPGEVIGADVAEIRPFVQHAELLPSRGRVLCVATGDGELALLSVQGEGGKRMSAEDYLRGHRQIVGSVLGT